jgi:hypothetical protein
MRSAAIDAERDQPAGERHGRQRNADARTSAPLSAAGVLDHALLRPGGLQSSLARRFGRRHHGCHWRYYD